MNKLAIVGSGPETRDLAPFDDETFDIWVLNEAPLHPWCKRYTASFQMHDKEIYTGYNTKAAGYWEWLQQKHDKPVYMKAQDDRIPDCVVYPLEEALALTGYKYFGMTTCYMMALAILQGYQHIEVWGVELSATEYMFGSDSWRYWVGYAVGMLGKDHVILHAGQHLLETALYGYEGGFSIGKEYFDGRAKLLDGKWQAAEKHLENMKKWVAKLIEKKEYNKAMESIQEYEDAAIYAGQLAGALAESERLAKFGDQPADRHEYERQAAIAQRDGELNQKKQWKAVGMVEYIWNIWVQTNGDPKAGLQLANMTYKLGGYAYDAGAMNGLFSESLANKAKFDAMNLAIGIRTAPEPLATVEMIG